MNKKFGIIMSLAFLISGRMRAESGLSGIVSQEKLKSLSDIIESGGLPMDIIIVLSVVGLFLVFYFLFTLRANAIYPKRFLREAEDAADEGDVEALEAICQSNSSAASRIVYAAAEHIVTDSSADYGVVRDAIEDEGARQAGLLWQRIQYLMDIAVVAPMVGLLGTVLGMLRSFAGLKTELGAVRPTVLAQGISQALVTTAAGLFVGIFATLLYALFRGRVSKLIAGLESSCNRILRSFLASRSRSRR